ncbi:TPA: hypothetical protein HA238_00375, partial [Candidatus Micrarchaeota archaeon]|nr:hypothetical protein [Candidatus Micrarchaeota archaeon]
MEKPIGIIEQAQAVLAVENGKKPGTSIRNRRMNLRNRLERALQPFSAEVLEMHTLFSSPLSTLNMERLTSFGEALDTLALGGETEPQETPFSKRTGPLRKRIRNALAAVPAEVSGAEALEPRTLLSSLPSLESLQAELVQIDEQLARAQSEQNLPKGQTITVTAQAVKAIGTSAGDFIVINYNNVPEGWTINIGGETRAVLKGGSGTINVSPPGIKGKHNVDLDNLEEVSQGTIS